MKTHFAIANVAEGHAHTMTMTGPAWDGQNPNGWTYQDATGAHGAILLETSDEDAAADAVRIYNADARRVHVSPSKTIAELEAASNTATAAYAAADTRLASLNTLINMITRLEDIDGLTAEDEADIASLRDRSHARRPALVAECDRLEDASRAAQRTLNDAPEEAA